MPLWEAAIDGAPDWPALFEGDRAAVDWPVAGFWRELSEVYPEARVILTTRSAESWCASFSETIQQVISDPEAAPEPARPVTRMARRAVMRSTGEDFSPEALIARFRAHEAAVQDSLPPERLLVFSPKEGWEPLCAFLGVPVPADEPFPRTNHREEFFANLDDIE